MRNCVPISTDRGLSPLPLDIIYWYEYHISITNWSHKRDRGKGDSCGCATPAAGLSKRKCKNHLGFPAPMTYYINRPYIAIVTSWERPTFTMEQYPGEQQGNANRCLCSTMSHWFDQRERGKRDTSPPRCKGRARTHHETGRQTYSAAARTHLNGETGPITRTSAQ